MNDEAGESTAVAATGEIARGDSGTSAVARAPSAARIDAEQLRAALDVAHRRALAWLDSVRDRPVRPETDVDGILTHLESELPERGVPAAEVVEMLADAAEPGLMAMGSPRFYGFVIGGTYPAALAADWLVSAWDQNTGSRQPTPATAAIEEVAAGWLVDLLGLPPGSGVGFVTGATSANLSCLVVARDAMVRRAGADPLDGLQRAPRVRFLAGGAVHTSVVLAGRIAGLGAPETVGADDQGRIDIDGLARALAAQPDAATVVALQAGDVHSGAFDDFTAAISVAHDAGAWVHVDGAFGLWAAASPRLRSLTAGVAEATRGAPTRTRPSTSRTTAVWRSCETRRRWLPRWRRTPRTSQRCTTRPTPTIASPSCRAVRAA